MEGSSIEMHRAAAVAAYHGAREGGCSPKGAVHAAAHTIAPPDVMMIFMSHMSEKSRQDAATTHAHMLVMIEYLKRARVLLNGSTIWDDTDGCTSQYRCGRALYLLSVLAVSSGITIDRAIGAPGHGKDLVDGQNAVDKHYLRGCMRRISVPEVKGGPKRMAAHEMVGDTKMNWAEECQRLLSDLSRAHGVKGEKRNKRQAEAKMKERKYVVQDPAKVKYTGINMEAKGWEAGEHNGIRGHYNFRFGPDLDRAGPPRAASRARARSAWSNSLCRGSRGWRPRSSRATRRARSASSGRR